MNPLVEKTFTRESTNHQGWSAQSSLLHLFPNMLGNAGMAVTERFRDWWYSGNRIPSPSLSPHHDWESTCGAGVCSCCAGDRNRLLPGPKVSNAACGKGPGGAAATAGNSVYGLRSPCCRVWHHPHGALGNGHRHCPTHSCPNLHAGATASQSGQGPEHEETIQLYERW